jgi:hypothetical protein
MELKGRALFAIGVGLTIFAAAARPGLAQPCCPPPSPPSYESVEASLVGPTAVTDQADSTAR